jgi:hypothetical protein
MHTSTPGLLGKMGECLVNFLPPDCYLLNSQDYRHEPLWDQNFFKA